MSNILGVLQILLAVLFFVAGFMKMTRSREEIKARTGERMAWVDDFSDGQLRAIGGVEVLGAVGLILPAITGILPFLTVLAALGLVLTMIGAAVVHIRRGEIVPSVIINAVIGLMAAIVAYGHAVAVPVV